MDLSGTSKCAALLAAGIRHALLHATKTQWQADNRTSDKVATVISTSTVSSERVCPQKSRRCTACSLTIRGPPLQSCIPRHTT